jgi:hypothetical protein
MTRLKRALSRHGTPAVQQQLKQYNSNSNSTTATPVVQQQLQQYNIIRVKQQLTRKAGSPAGCSYYRRQSTEANGIIHDVVCCALAQYSLYCSRACCSHVPSRCVTLWGGNCLRWRCQG